MQTKTELSTSMLSKVIVLHLHTYRQTDGRTDGRTDIQIYYYYHYAA